MFQQWCRFLQIVILELIFDAFHFIFDIIPRTFVYGITPQSVRAYHRKTFFVLLYNYYFFYSFQELNLLPAVIIDNGSGLCKCGLATDPAPTHVFPAIIGRPKYEEAMLGAKYQDVYLGDAAQSYRGMLKIKYPLDHGVVTDWNDMEMVRSFFSM